MNKMFLKSHVSNMLWSLRSTLVYILTLTTINVGSFVLMFNFTENVMNEIHHVNNVAFIRYVLLNTLAMKINILYPSYVTTVIEDVVNDTSINILESNKEIIIKTTSYCTSTYNYNELYINNFIENVTLPNPSIEDVIASYYKAFIYQDHFTHYIVTKVVEQIQVVQTVIICIMCLFFILTIISAWVLRYLSKRIIRNNELSTEQTTISYLCHEMKSSILPIEMMLRDISDNEYTHEEISTKTNSILNLIQDHNYILARRLDFTKIINSDYKLNDETFDLILLLKEILEKYAIRINNNIDVQIKCPYDEIWIKTDNFIIRTIIINLIKNAIKYTHQGHVHVDVTFDVLTNDIEIRIVDTGIGMTDEVKNNFFNKIHTNNYHNSYGIGISIVSKMCTVLKKSSLELISSKPNEGTIISFKCKSNSNVKAYRSRNLSYDNTQEISKDIHRPIYIFVVDDCRIIRRCLKQLFEKQKWMVNEFNNGEELLAALSNSSMNLPDVIIIDEHMQQGGGILEGTDIIYLLKTDYKFKGCIIHMSGSTVHSIADVTWDKPPPNNSQIISTITNMVNSNNYDSNLDNFL